MTDASKDARVVKGQPGRHRIGPCRVFPIDGDEVKLPEGFLELLRELDEADVRQKLKSASTG